MHVHTFVHLRGRIKVIQVRKVDIQIFSCTCTLLCTFTWWSIYFVIVVYILLLSAHTSNTQNHILSYVIFFVLLWRLKLQNGDILYFEMKAFWITKVHDGWMKKITNGVHDKLNNPLYKFAQIGKYQFPLHFGLVCISTFNLIMQYLKLIQNITIRVFSSAWLCPQS